VRAGFDTFFSAAEDMDMNELTREELSARLETVEARIDARFAESNARIETRFAESNARIEARFAEADAKADVRFAQAEAKNDARFAQIDARFAEANARTEARFAELEAKFQKTITDLIKWMVGTAIAATAVLATLMMFVINNATSEPVAPTAMSADAPFRSQ
jgi:Skp family chaperone for outer membrane proteins